MPATSKSAKRMAQQPLPSMFNPPLPGYVDPPIIYPEFISFLMDPDFTPTMCDTPDDDEQEENVEEIHVPEDLVEVEVL